MQKQREFIRSLARQVMDIAQNDEMPAIIKRWKDVNELRKPDRAPVWCRPVGCWSEMLPEDSLVCTDKWLRGLEVHFRQILIKADIGDDTPVMPYFDVPAVIEVTPKNTWGVDINHIPPAEKDGAWAYDPPLKSMADFEKLVKPTYSFNRQASMLAMERLHELLGDIMPLRMKFGPGYDSATIGTAAADLRGLMEMMMDTVCEPELLHRLMKFLVDSRIGLLDEYEKFRNDLVCNNDDAMLLSDDFGPSDGPLSLLNCWCAGNSQEFDQISPDMFEEFCLQYQMPIFERFGRVCYGCCENLSKKIDRVLKIPNLRIFVIAPGQASTCLWNTSTAITVLCGDRWPPRWSCLTPPMLSRQASNWAPKSCKVNIIRSSCANCKPLPDILDRLKVWTQLAKDAVSRYS